MSVKCTTHGKLCGIGAMQVDRCIEAAEIEGWMLSAVNLDGTVRLTAAEHASTGKLLRAAAAR